MAWACDDSFGCGVPFGEAMQRRSFWITAGLALVLTMPLAGATWYTRGSFEPDTPQDVNGGFMFTEPDTNPDQSFRQVYFNAVPQDRNSASLNPNVGPLESRYLPAGQMGFSAHLGFWKDCNRDGYLGHAEGALMHYRSELLIDSTICPSNGYFNRAGWVSEFVPIAGPPGNETGVGPTKFPRVHKDTEARVWGDFGLPGDPDGVHYDCAQFPFPVGTFESTGGLLVYVDCQLGYNIARNVNENDPTGTLGFEDRYHPERDCGSPLNQGVPGGMYGNNPCSDETGTFEDTDDRMFTVWDCSEPAGTADVRDPTAPPGERGSLSRFMLPEAAGYGGETHVGGDDGSYRKVPLLAPSVGNPEGSLTAGLDNFQVGATQNCREDTSYWSNLTYLESDFSATNPTDGKRMVDFHMGYANQSYGAGGQGTPGGQGTTNQGGLFLSDNGAWSSDVTYLPPTYLGGTIRNSDLGPAGGLYFTFYAKVGQATKGSGLKLPSASVGIYGAEACTDGIAPGAGKQNNWDCDPTHWWNPDMGGTFQWNGARPGDSYDLRDIDCYDGRVADGVYASLALVSEDGPCADV